MNGWVCISKKNLNLSRRQVTEKENRERGQFDGTKRIDFTGFWKLPRVCW